MYSTTLALPALMAACIIAPSIIAGMPITKAVAEPDIIITSEAVDGRRKSYSIIIISSIN